MNVTLLNPDVSVTIPDVYVTLPNTDVNVFGRDGILEKFSPLLAILAPFIVDYKPSIKT